MAKQSGLHQIKGKIGEFSYYKQTGVSGGLIRGINQGLSARVKSDAAYANTRLNNLEFGAAANVASLLGQMVTPKFRPMILPFSQSKMAKEILKLARQNVSPWGQRVVANAQTPQIAATLAAMSKRDFAEFMSAGLEYVSGNDYDAQFSYTAEQATLMASLGINGIALHIAVFNLATGQFNAITGEMSTGYLETVESISPELAGVTAGQAESDSESVQIPTFIPAANHGGHQIAVFVAMPYRAVDGVNHILQEYCRFTAFVVPARA